MKLVNKMKSLNNFLGAFADGAVLFPLVMTLALQNGMNLSYLLLSSGIAYLVAGYIFRIPMSVQPLKSIAIAGLAVGASSAEIRAAAVILGFLFISSLLFDLETYAKKVPESLIHGVQAGLGIILIQQGLKYILPSGVEYIIFALLIVAFMLFITYKYQYPILGIIGSIGFFVSIFLLKKSNIQIKPVIFDPSSFRPLLICSLVLPQIILTSANSVLATVNVSRRYFGDKAGRVTVRRLVYMIGFGNILSGLLGGLPFCHGSGGITAHYNGGARSNLSNYFIGSILFISALIVSIFGGVQVIFPALLLSVLLMTVGFMHVALASPSWIFSKSTKIQLVLMALSALISGNMLWVLGCGIFYELFNRGMFFIIRKKVV
jgi:MFS superfamily sulfate permease-like transporter